MNIFRILTLCIGLYSGFSSDTATEVHHCKYSLDVGFILFLALVFIGCLPFGIVPLLGVPPHKLQPPSLSLPPFRHNCPIMFTLMASLFTFTSCIGVIIKSLFSPVDWHAVTIVFTVATGLFCSFLLGKRSITRKIASV
jgi:hypothetical protein